MDEMPALTVQFIVALKRRGPLSVATTRRSRRWRQAARRHAAGQSPGSKRGSARRHRVSYLWSLAEGGRS
jgi:hypothetical protein